MIKGFITLLLAINISITFSQTIKTDVLVIGDGAAGAATAIQCARSKVKTVLAINDSLQVFDLAASGMVTVNNNKNTPSGIWAEFRKHVQRFYQKTVGYDTTYNAALRFEPKTGAKILKEIIDTIKNLTVRYNNIFEAVKKDGDAWEVTLKENGNTIQVKAKVVVDATENAKVVAKAGAKINTQSGDEIKIYRTSIAAGEVAPEKTAASNKYPSAPAYSIPLKSVLVKDANNLLYVNTLASSRKDIQNLPLEFQLGQGVATVAAYCAFFKTTTKNLRARIIQGELLDFKANLLPFADIPVTDLNWRAIQQVGATGLLKGTSNSDRFLFRPDSLVSTTEIKPVLTEIYTRAFLWFLREKPSEKFTVGNLLSFIGDYTLTDSKVLISSIQKNWKSQYKFDKDFNLNRQVTRREFAVLANRFLNPFARTVDLDGNVVN